MTGTGSAAAQPAAGRSAAELILRTWLSPAERPATAEHVGQALEQIASGRPTASLPTTARAQKRSWLPRRRRNRPELEPEHAAFFGANVRPGRAAFRPRSGIAACPSGSARGRQSGRRSNHERDHGYDDPLPRRAEADAGCAGRGGVRGAEDRNDRSDRDAATAPWIATTAIANDRE